MELWYTRHKGFFTAKYVKSAFAQEAPMEHVLLKMARQLDALDEASLMGLWEKYAQIVNHFEPSQRWQEAVLVLSLIQAKHWKNQLFNVQWSERLRSTRQDETGADVTGSPFPPGAAPFSLDSPAAPRATPEKRARVLNFTPDDSSD